MPELDVRKVFSGTTVVAWAKGPFGDTFESKCYFGYLVYRDNPDKRVRAWLDREFIEMRKKLVELGADAIDSDWATHHRMKGVT